MDIKTENVKIGDIDFEKESFSTTPDDGFVHNPQIEPLDMSIENQQKHHMGYSVNKTYTTDNPKVTRPFAYGICALFFIIGFFQLIFGGYFFGITFIAVSILSFFLAKRDIDKVAEKYKEEGKDPDLHSAKEAAEVTGDVAKVIGTELKNSVKEVISQAKNDTKR